MSLLREEMFEIDRRATEIHKIRPILLMENVALGIFNEINKYDSYTIVCGNGNNGGDGVALARHLLIDKRDVDIFIMGEPQSEELIENLEILRTFTNNIYKLNEEEDLVKLVDSLEVNEVTVDCIFGIGLCRDVRGIFEKVIEEINRHSNYIISIDIPSGVEANTGEVLNTSVIANETMTVYEIKKGMVDNELCGKVTTIYLGVPGL
ncbi:NAD(P)H-hydrate epimerase [Anaerosphaera multitolerans]|uniref:NAD(P)H-hydrate epimerase n=1 Tax=Anaerosphaera multitolerans TaxID=2487351 RepID=A0A437S9C6_9FIRM|nr:NAD(P)H-hydrate epimerase [Anaerosphaera multitolerans]RVU55726.1 NAD(P)H-hydrate epimerase [Anaerosphaera multitolerans]